MSQPSHNVDGAGNVIDVRTLLNHSLESGAAAITLREQIISAAVTRGFALDLYEPTIDVSDNGIVYVSGHTFGADVTGAPVFKSADDGKTWTQLPFLMTQTMPGTMHGATPPPSAEIFVVAGERGAAWGVDITLATFPVNGWADNGSRHVYHNPNAYDDQQAATQAANCVPAPIKDRPWAAYANGTLLMVNNPARGPAQIGILPVPPQLPLGLGSPPIGVGTTLTRGWWNLCAGPSFTPATCEFPGIPDIRNDGLFAVPQRCPEGQYLIIGNKADVMDVGVKFLSPVSTEGQITRAWSGQAGFDADGALFVAITNNSMANPDSGGEGQIRVWTSTDDAKTFGEYTLRMGASPVRHLYMDPNKFGPGALLTWALDGTTRGETFHWYAGHLMLGTDDELVLANASLVVQDGPMPSAEVNGAAVGPDGRAYIVTDKRRFSQTYSSPDVGMTPLSLWVQQTGPMLPVASPG